MHHSAPFCTIDIWSALPQLYAHTSLGTQHSLRPRDMAKWTGQKRKKESQKNKTEKKRTKRPNIDKTMSSMIWREPANLRPRSLRKKRTAISTIRATQIHAFLFFWELWPDNLGQILTIGCAPKAIPAKDFILWANPTLHESWGFKCSRWTCVIR